MLAGLRAYFARIIPGVVPGDDPRAIRVCLIRRAATAPAEKPLSAPIGLELGRLQAAHVLPGHRRKEAALPLPDRVAHVENLAGHVHFAEQRLELVLAQMVGDR